MMVLGKENNFLWKVTPFLTEIFYHNVGLERVGLYHFTNDLDIHISFFAWFFVAFKFEELIPPTKDTEDRTETFFSLYDSERSFRISHQESFSVNVFMG